MSLRLRPPLPEGEFVLRAGSPGQVLAAKALERRVWIVAALVLVGLAAVLRLSLLARSNWLLEGDDALSALMALGILDGDRPIMLKNQTYAAAWEPYAMAISYALLGVSRVSAKLPALLGSLGLIGTTWLLAREVAGRAAAWFAALLIAAPPVYVLVLSLKPWAPYTEVMLFGSLSLLCAMRLGWPRPAQRDLAWALGCGMAGGIALWMHPLAVWYLAAAAIVILIRARGTSRLAKVIGCGLAGFALGGLPIWLFNLQTGGATLRFILAGSQGQTAERSAVVQAWWTNDLPRGTGLWHPWGPSSWLLGALMAIWLVGIVAWAVMRRQPRLRPLDAVLVLLVLIPAIYVLSGFGGPSLNPYGFDATGRYTPPIWVCLSVVGGAALAAVWQRRRLLAIGLAIVPVAINCAGLVAIDPLAAFQSPYWDRLPAESGQLLAILREEGVQVAVMNHWAGQPLMFDAAATSQKLIAYDWYDVQAGGIDRFPEYLPVVRSSARFAYVLVTNEPEPALERRLDELGVAFIERRAPPYVVVIPTSRRVDPSEVTAALDYRY